MCLPPSQSCLRQILIMTWGLGEAGRVALEGRWLPGQC